MPRRARHVEISPPGHRDPQRRHRRQRRHRARSILGAADLHPEVPSAHSILAAAVGVVLQAGVGSAPMPVSSTTSPSANGGKGATRRWSSVDDFMREVANARIYEVIHDRHTTEVGLRMGRQIGELAANALLVLPQ